MKNATVAFDQVLSMKASRWDITELTKWVLNDLKEIKQFQKSSIEALEVKVNNQCDDLTKNVEIFE